eukprot:TRINITY_DN91883_c0_g1_i1.p1 TRINITY_DN91883_c0_g1~~TRINITY_DN91883_c0_g1_i1.p1  ORF type:complete len:460 (+),score=84.71 TRINITY_DN91883_c0_g1_i1:49-1380(+)
MVKGAWEDEHAPRVGSAPSMASSQGTSFSKQILSRATSKQHNASPYPGSDFVPRGQPGQPRQPKLSKGDGLPLQIRLEHKQIRSGALIGKCRRNAMTGEIITEKPVDYPNFQVVDLAGRKRLPVDRSELEKDPYLFRPVPLEYRTWIYQSHFLDPENVRGKNDLDYVVREALNAWCLDVKMLHSRWSPMMAYAFIMFVAALTSHAWIIMSVVILGLFSCNLSTQLNQPSVYQWDRWATLPLRLGLLLMLIIIYPSESTIEVIGSITTILLVIAELIFGDLQLINTYRFHCSFSIYKSLGSRIFVCKRDGGATLREVFHKGVIDNVDERITGVAHWDEKFHLIAEMEGLMVELKPMSKDDWRLAAAEYNWHLEPLTFVSIPLIEYDGVVQVKELDEEDILVPTKNSRRAMRGTMSLNSLQTFRDARDLFEGGSNLDWMIEEVEG